MRLLGLAPRRTAAAGLAMAIVVIETAVAMCVLAVAFKVVVAIEWEVWESHPMRPIHVHMQTTDDFNHKPHMCALLMHSC